MYNDIIVTIFGHRRVCFRCRRRDGIHEKRFQDTKRRRGSQEAGEVDEEHAGILYADRFGVEWFVD